MNDKGINVLSLFDGMSCGRIALERAGIKVYRYYASEIDKHAIKVSLDNWFDVVQIGSVTDLHYKDGVLFNSETGFSVKVKIDLLIGGSPCQGFSFAGKQLNFDDPRSALFLEYVRLWNEIEAYNPNAKFLLENVKMKKEYEAVISDYLFVKPIGINSALVSAQNRQRLYWTNLKSISLPTDKNIVLSDIIQKQVSVKYIMNDNQLSKLIYSDSGASKKIKILAHRANYKRNCQVYDISGQTECLDTGSGGGRTASIAFGGRIVGRRKDDAGKRCDSSKTFPVKQYLELNGDFDKSNCLTTVEKDNIIFECGAGNFVRKLTPIEYERLQTVPDNYTQSVSDSQRYKMLGNGWTVDVIVHIFSFYKP